MNLDDFLRTSCQVAYCISYDTFLSIFNATDDYYFRDKYELMQNNFSKWYCSLDSTNSERFVEYVKGRL